MLGEIDIVMGAFSKTFASNGGFVATRHAGRALVRRGVRRPAHVLELDVAHPDGDGARGAAHRAVGRGATSPRALMTNVDALRTALSERGLECLGDPSAVVPVLIGHTPLARLASGGVLRRGLFANLVEFPAVGVRAARFRMQVQADHTPAQAREGARLLAEAVQEARTQLARQTPVLSMPAVAPPAAPAHAAPSLSPLAAIQRAS
jgi:7-keto-8-aminopelargonate synthetase-like enzyme